MLAFEVPMSLRDQFDTLVMKHRCSRSVTLRDAELAIGAQIISAGLGALKR